MALTPEEVRRMEEQADLSDRFNKAADRYVAGNDPRLRAAEREQVLRQREGDVFAAARQRRLESQNLTALTDPGRYAPQVYKQAKQWHDERGLRDHELAMLDKQNKGALDIQAEKTKTAGEAARQTGLTNIELENLRVGYTDDNGVFHPGSQTLLEREKMQNGIDILDRQLQQQERIAEMEHGTIGPDGNVIPGSRERVATISGQSAVQQQTEANKGLAAQAEINRQKQQEKLDADLRRTIINANSKLGAAEIKAHSDKIKAAIEAGKWNGKDPAMVLAEMAEDQKDNPDMLRSISAAATIYGVQMDGGQQQGNVAQKYQDGQIVDVDGGKARFDAKTKKFVMVK